MIQWCFPQSTSCSSTFKQEIVGECVTPYMCMLMGSASVSLNVAIYYWWDSTTTCNSSGKTFSLADFNMIFSVKKLQSVIDVSISLWCNYEVTLDKHKDHVCRIKGKV